MIDSFAFIHRLNSIKIQSQRVTSALMEGLRINRFEPMEIFISPGNYAGSLYFIQEGIVRGAVDVGKEKATTWFKKEGDLIVPQGLFNQTTSDEYISAVLKTTLLTIPVIHIQKTLKTYPEVQELITLLINESASEAQYREKLLRIPSAKNRYDFLSEHEDYILKRIPHFMTASYLNVTKQTFSRINKGLDY
ncbi:Crp/Fnr family transcriptional regulator [Mucilaginibacter rubeus]|jgi:CRP-like cAMP-binding protein|uniref:Crp/Fnr family transcriptional regulator n=1 Tax=Mucilaginibacter rubeus TaxID=2027860 RepID=A0AAE6JG14_9SPHI|nr:MULTISPECIES: Crp/Fnr family transcriptional regulator [Mucilaginibacter]QEM04888.1 Crp/Fnr family transcriptional regulator [Mucilaginibacter rubeus]QEM17482.1 Crp/Fnr family transcriptional regulator [Mucilaginibacter gossypii]QTE45997.1 Crp/Fnr family transcriptional regulator [Mucilaginibacter rubeus]QTE52594.1 Crp/Fnr family transcriptional regulator [Mucilaginibacter rubeus]QTE57683.1 Crp/Fnr family transcriptional regulator [Mucilaginibacter rubeus]